MIVFVAVATIADIMGLIVIEDCSAYYSLMSLLIGVGAVLILPPIITEMIIQKLRDEGVIPPREESDE